MTDDLASTIVRALHDAAAQARAKLGGWLADPETRATVTPEDFAALVVAPNPWTERPPAYLARAGQWAYVVTAVVVAHRDASLVHAARLAALVDDGDFEDPFVAHSILDRWSTAHGAIAATQLRRAFEEQRLPTDGVLGLALDLGARVTAASMATLLEDEAGRVPEMLEATRAWLRNRRRVQLVRTVEHGPVSARLADALVPYALHAPRELAPKLRRALRSVPTARIAEILASTNKDDRAAAVEWLSERRDPTAVPALMAAMKKDKSEAVRAACVGALEACGTEAPIDRAALEKDATKLLAKGWPEALAFVDHDTLPTLRWKDGADVSRAIVDAWLLAAYRAKDPDPSPLVTTLAARMEPEGVRAFARAVLDRFITWDTRIPTDLTDEEKQRLEFALNNFADDQSAEALLARPDAKNYGLPTRSGVAEKGVLGVVAAFGGAELVPTIEAYVKTHRGFRSSQCRALLTVLSWIDDARATQSLLQIASRFRTPGIQKEARLLADALAARRGWTVADLADRTVPTAGLDDDGTLTLVYGLRVGEGEDATIDETRRFVASLDSADALVLKDAEGAVVKALPDARKDEDEAVVAEAKKRFAAARKDVKTLVAAQRERLHEAMLGERRWPVAEFQRYVLDHPVLGRLARRVLFAAFDGEQLVASFRPTDDGSFAGANNETVHLAANAHVGLLHSRYLTPALEAAWGEHVADYEIVPLFAQLGRVRAPAECMAGNHLVPPDAGTANAMKVRSRAKSAGYSEVRGDGGWITSFTKSLPTLGRSLVIDVEGIQAMPEPKDTVAVTGIAVWEGGDAGQPGNALRWDEVGDVMRDEAWNELNDVLR